MEGTKKFKLYNYNDVIIDFSEFKMTQRDIILAKCHECCCYDSREVKLCPSKSCPLWLYKEKHYKTPRRPSDKASEILKQYHLKKKQEKTK